MKKSTTCLVLSGETMLAVAAVLALACSSRHGTHYIPAGKAAELSYENQRECGSNIQASLMTRAEKVRSVWVTEESITIDGVTTRVRSRATLNDRPIVGTVMDVGLAAQLLYEPTGVSFLLIQTASASGLTCTAAAAVALRAAP